ncbi:AGAP010502-PA [Anopheles gambiae str. PEST]|uniref:AGAP010502-PA n=2 Tax=gambiae species complex TaxID=44542 RepID=A0NDZ5_ANOGA|nr:AGAP010502-PA [Anopheles gambiae str. PEST]
MRRKCQTSPVRAIFPGHPECCTIGYHVRLHLKFPDKINSLHRRRHRPRCLRWFDSFTHGNVHAFSNASSYVLSNTHFSTLPFTPPSSYRDPVETLGHRSK